MTEPRCGNDGQWDGRGKPEAGFPLFHRSSLSLNTKNERRSLSPDTLTTLTLQAHC